MEITAEYYSKCYRALIFDEEEEYLDFIEQITKLLKKTCNGALYHNRGVAYKELGKNDLAKDDFEKALEIFIESSNYSKTLLSELT